MTPVAENKNTNKQRSGSDSTIAPTTIQTNATQAFNKEQDNTTNNRREEEKTRRAKRRPTKVGLNDILRRIRHLIVEGRSNLEIQNILQLEERTFYRYMAKINEIDQALFSEQEKKTVTTEIRIFKDRLLNAYRWYIAIAHNENIKADIRMEAQSGALDVAYARFKVERDGPRVIEKGRSA